MKFTPLYNNVLVRLETYAGAVLLPEDTKNSTNKGVVIAIGTGDWDNEKECFNTNKVVCVGDVVLFEKKHATTVDQDGETLYLVSDWDILGVYK